MAERIVSLIASATEIVAGLGFGNALVGRSHECDFPPSVKRLPALTEPRFPINGSSRQIDWEVKALLEQGLSVYKVDAQKLREINPTIIVTQTQCEVCAVSRKDVENALCEWLGTGAAQAKPKIVSLEPNSLADFWADIRRVARALNKPERGETLIRNLHGRMKKIESKAKAAPRRPAVAVIEWIDPLMSGGNWMPELIDMAGGLNLFGATGKHSPYLQWEDLAAKNPDIILTVPCGYDIPKTRQELGPLLGNPLWPKLKAVQTGQAYIADGNQYFNRPGPRLAESLEILAEILRPKIFNFGHEGRGWQRIHCV